MIFKLDHINQITALEKHLQSNNIKEDYLHKSFEVVNKTLVKHFGKKYLLHRGYFIEDDGNLNVLKFKDIEKLQNKISLSHINAAEDLVHQYQIPPFTKIILDKHLQGLVLYAGKKPPLFGRLIIQNLKVKSCTDSLAKHLKVKKKEIERLVLSYQLHSIDLKGSLYAYFIRPFAEHEVYNGILLLLLQRPIKEDEFMEIGHLWTKVLSETALLKIAKLAKAAEQEFIFEEHTHTWNTEIGEIVQNLDIVYKRVKSGASRRVSNDIFMHIKSAYFNVQRLRNINAFNLFLMKTRGIKGWAELNEIKSHIGDDNIFEELKIKTINLKELFKTAIVTIEAMLKSFEYVNKKSIERKLKALKLLQQGIKKTGVFRIQTIQTGLKIILLDLLKNALFHADSENPIVELITEMTDDYLLIHFINNSKLSSDAYEYINNNKFHSELSLRRKGGIRTIKRILNSPLLSESGLQWKLMAMESSLTEKTDIVLFVPKSDVK